jgi:hypothetical protein
MDLAFVDTTCAPDQFCILLKDVDMVTVKRDFHSRANANPPTAQNSNSQDRLFLLSVVP